MWQLKSGEDLLVYLVPPPPGILSLYPGVECPTDCYTSYGLFMSMALPGASRSFILTFYGRVPVLLLALSF